MNIHEFISSIHDLGHETPVMLDTDTVFSVAVRIQNRNIGVITWNNGKDGLLQFFQANFFCPPFDFLNRDFIYGTDTPENLEQQVLNFLPRVKV